MEKENKVNSKIDFISFLKLFDKSKLSGRDAHIKLSPTKDGKLIRSFLPTEDAKQAAVLLLLYNDIKKNEINLMFTFRSENLKSHSSQISFPGGMIENNVSLEETALLETFEEIGIEKRKIEILLSLTDLFVPPSNFIIYPFVGYIDELPELKINTEEVMQAFSIPLDYFIENSVLKSSESSYNGLKFDYLYWDIGMKSPLWGATAMILQEFLELYQLYLSEK